MMLRKQDFKKFRSKSQNHCEIWYVSSERVEVVHVENRGLIKVYYI